jgi:ABC-type uncharacterized transport system permease subunit
MDEVAVGTLIASTLRVATPLTLCALAGVLCERSGVIDLGLEGKMLLAAFAAGSVGAVSGSLALALLAALAVGLALSMLHGYACVSHRGDQVVMGMAITMTAAGLTVVLGIAWFHQGGQTPALPDTVRLGPQFTGLAAALREVPIIGTPIALGLLGHNVVVYGALLAVPAVWWLLYRTRFGLRLRAVGENPGAVDTAGVSVVRLRYAAVMIAGLLCGVAGAYLSTGMAAGFNPDMTAGKGFIALAALIFAKWRPWPALGACLLFGALEAIGIRYQAITVPGVGVVPVQFMQALPYILTVVILAGFVGKAIPPKAGGRPYVKER